MFNPQIKRHLKIKKVVGSKFSEFLTIEAYMKRIKEETWCGRGKTETQMLKDLKTKHYKIRIQQKKSKSVDEIFLK